jgi:hypothetical protein
VILDVRSDMSKGGFNEQKYILTKHKPDSAIKIHRINPNSSQFFKTVGNETLCWIPNRSACKHQYVNSPRHMQDDWSYFLRFSASIPQYVFNQGSLDEDCQYIFTVVRCGQCLHAADWPTEDDQGISHVVGSLREQPRAVPQLWRGAHIAQGREP